MPLAGALLLLVLWKLLRRPKPKPHIQTALCPSCGWQGQVSRYAGRCPRCSTPLGDQKAKR